jgi:hypothetical protein
MQDMNPRGGSGQLIGELPGTVRGVIVDHQHFYSRVLMQNGRDHEREVDPLVVGRNHDQEPFSHVAGED